MAPGHPHDGPRWPLRSTPVGGQKDLGRPCAGAVDPWQLPRHTAALCGAALWCPMPCVVLCRSAVLCCAVPPCVARPHYVVQNCAALCCAVLCCAPPPPSPCLDRPQPPYQQAAIGVLPRLGGGGGGGGCPTPPSPYQRHAGALRAPGPPRCALLAPCGCSRSALRALCIRLGALVAPCKRPASTSAL